MLLSASPPTTPGARPCRMLASAHKMAAMGLAAATAMLSTMGSSPLRGEELTFNPPQQQPAERYEASWRKNPFILKTAPVVVEMQSFARDLAIGSMYQVGDEVTVVVVNTRTRERTILRGSKASSTGMRLKLASIKDIRKDSTAVVEQGGKEATLRYDTSYLKHVASSGAALNTRGKPPGQVTAHAPATNMPAPIPPDYVSSNLDAEPGDTTAIVESVHGVGSGMTFDPAPPPTSTATAIPSISNNLDAEPGTAAPAPPENSGSITTAPPPNSDPNPAPPPAPDEP